MELISELKKLRDLKKYSYYFYVLAGGGLAFGLGILMSHLIRV